MVERTQPGIALSFEECLMRYAGQRCEYVAGHAVPMAPTKFGQGKVTGRLHTLLGAYVLDHDLGEVLGAETGFLMRAADIAFIPKARAA